MPDLYERHLPPPEVAVELPTEELALFVLRFLNDPDAGSTRNRYSFTLMSSTNIREDGAERRGHRPGGSLGLAGARRSHRSQARANGRVVRFEVPRRGKTLTAQADFEAYKRGNLLRRESLDPLLEQKVWPLFIRGDYDVAVFQAFKLVEVRVRELGGFPDSDFGVTLMERRSTQTRGR